MSLLSVFMPKREKDPAQGVYRIFRRL